MNRRDLLKSGIVLATEAWAPSLGLAALAQANSGAAGEGSEQGPAQTPVGGPVIAKDNRWCLDRDWLFHLGHGDDPQRDFDFGEPGTDGVYSKGRIALPVLTTAFNSGNWRRVDLPHDWAVELPMVREKHLEARGSRRIGRLYPESSIGWYRRRFSVAADNGACRFYLVFDGIFRNAQIFLNSHLLARHSSGYTGLRVDITDYLRFAGENLLVVRVDASEGEGWFYEGAGIYRHVWLERTPALALVADGTFVQPKLQGNAAQVSITCEVANHLAHDAPCRLVCRVLDAQRREVARAESSEVNAVAGLVSAASATVRVGRPALWDVDSPHLYRAEITLMQGSHAVHRTEIPFGIRSLEWTADRGLFLNGRHLLLQGSCNHGDHAGVGTAIPDFLHEWRVRQLKSWGTNAVRWAHNPVSAEVLDACDRQGLLVISETRAMASTPDGLEQLRQMVRAARNHPSIMLWSMANEEPDQGNDTGERILRSMKQELNRLDPSRLCIAAMNDGFGHGLSDVIDVQGVNYNTAAIDAFHGKFPQKPMLGSETSSAWSTRGEYRTEKTRGILSAYDENPPSYGDTAEQWVQFFAKRPFLAGGFVWSGFDYRGEPTPTVEVSYASQFGFLDQCGFPKDIAFYYKSAWSREPVLHLLPHWNWKVGEKVRVWCYTNLPSVELFLNGRSLGARTVERLDHAAWDVRFEPGLLEARGRRAQTVVRVDRRRTAGPASAIRLTADKPSLQARGTGGSAGGSADSSADSSADGIGSADGSVVQVAVVDAQGVVVPDAAQVLSFFVEGDAVLLGVGNGDPNGTDPEKASSCRAFHGLCTAILQTDSRLEQRSGDVVLRVEGSGLQSASLTWKVQAARPGTTS